MIEDLQATFLHRLTTLARTRLAHARAAVIARDAAGLVTAARDLHSLAGEAGLLGLAELVPLARRGEDRIKQAIAAPDEPTDDVLVLIGELGGVVERLAVRKPA